MGKFAGLVFILIAGLFAAQPALAGNWTATKLRGLVFVNNLRVDNKWVPLKRGDVVADDRYIRTLASGRVHFTNGSEAIDVGPKTQIRILDRAEKKTFTTVKQDYGRVGVVADVEKVKHFAVDTPLLVAVVKGTKFTVVSGPRGASVSVIRGLVGVTDRKSGQVVNLPAGQQLFASDAGRLSVTGRPSGNALAGEDVPDARTSAVAVPAAAGGDDGALVGTLGTSVQTLGTTTNSVLGDVVGTAGTAVGGVVGTAGHAVGGVVGTTGGVVGGVGQTVGDVVHGVGGLLHL